MRTLRLCHWMLLSAGLLFGGLAQALPVVQRYEFSVTLDCFFMVSLPPGETPPGPDSNGCVPLDHVGDTTLHTPYVGEFAFDASMVTGDGWYTTQMLDFRFSTGYMVFDSTIAEGLTADGHLNGYAGFKGRAEGVLTPSGANVWGIKIEDGKLVEFCCYVYGLSDTVGLDFYFEPGSPVLLRGYGGGPSSPDRSYYMARGSYAFREVHEPVSAGAMALALLALAIRRRSRKRRGHER